MKKKLNKNTPIMKLPKDEPSLIEEHAKHFGCPYLKKRRIDYKTTEYYCDIDEKKCHLINKNQ